MSASQDAQSLPVEKTDDIRPKKRPKRSIADAEADDSKSGRQPSKSCSNCRRLKVKCEWTNNGRDCSRCARLRLTCLREKKSWTQAEDNGNESTQMAITKLERAMEDVLEKLNMPALDLYALPRIIKPRQPTRSRPTSEDRGENDAAQRERDVSPDPMNSLIEATQMNGLRSQLRSVKLRRKGGMRRKEHDLIAEKLITINEAEELLSVFQKMQSVYLFSATIASDATLESLRNSSTVLFTAVMLVAALLLPGKEWLHETCQKEFMGLVSSVMFDRFHSLDDIRGLCVAALWEPYLSWKLSGLSIRMATELNLHHAFYTAFYESNTSAEERKESLEKSRLWYLLYVLDHQSSIAYGRPPVMSELRPIKDFEILLTSDTCTSADRALISQVTGLVTLGRAFDVFGLEPRRTMAGDDASVLQHSRYTESIERWRDDWTTLSESETSENQVLSRSIGLQFHFSNLVLNSLVLRGRPLDKIVELPASLRPLALKAVEAAHGILQHFLDDPKRGEEIVGMPLYLHSIIAFAVVFLMKLAPRWHVIGITIDVAQRTIPLVERTIKMLEECKAGANHMVFSMAKGFERMLRQLRRSKIATGTQAPSDSAHGTANRTIAAKTSVNSLENRIQYPDILQPNTSYGFYAPALNSSADVNITNGTPGTADSAMSYGNWDLQDEELWSVGMGYDLLEPGGQGLAGLEFPFQTPTW